MKPSYSFIIPVYNRPQETLELLESFTKVRFKDAYEIVLVEDGSTETSEAIVKQFSSELSITYLFKENTGPGDSRNYGMLHAKGNYFIILDSDVLMPAHYLETIDAYVTENFVHCFGGADAAHESFTPLQKAINYVMTSFLTTGGIRGNTTSVNTFEPRSFNMGISKEAFEATGGFAKIHPGEDPDLSQRIKKAGFQTTFIPNAAVFHKRRISWEKFHIQVRKFGMVRPILNSWHPNAAKLTFWFPTLFVGFVLCSVLLAIFWNPWVLIPLIGYVFVLFIDSSMKNRSIYIGWLSVMAVFVQFFWLRNRFCKEHLLYSVVEKKSAETISEVIF